MDRHPGRPPLPPRAVSVFGEAPDRKSRDDVSSWRVRIPAGELSRGIPWAGIPPQQFFNARELGVQNISYFSHNNASSVGPGTFSPQLTALACGHREGAKFGRAGTWDSRF